MQCVLATTIFTGWCNMLPMDPKKRLARATKRFWSRVDVKGPNQCWLWKGRWRRPTAAPEIYWMGRNTPVSRISFELHSGKALPKYNRHDKKSPIVMHSCDNPPCCNPAHLKKATHLENARDREAKSRGGQTGNPTAGESRPNAKLTEQSVKEIRRKYIPRKYPVRRLAKEYRVGIHLITAVLKRKRWKHV
jgi:hypothetical protein